MKNIILLLVCTLLAFGSKAQSLIGAWEGYHSSDGGEKLRSVAIFSEGYQVITTYDSITGKFVGTNGGAWKISGDTVTKKVEFDSTNSEAVGTELSFKFSIDHSNLDILGTGINFKRIDDGTPGQLQGAWLMSGRVVDGETNVRDTSGPRKTMKILSGTRFQWIAYDTATKQFMATGGGTYTTINGKYAENIEFFSRDDSRVGMELTFNYSLIDANWHHSGLSSKGDPIHEIWSKRL
ncbi:MAG: membrane or secreted protein [Aequorivita sp.]